MEKLGEHIHAPRHSHITETLSGSSTIRAYGKQQYYLDEAFKHINATTAHDLWNQVIDRWLGIRQSLLQAFLMSGTFTCCILFRERINPVHVGMMVGYMLHDAGVMSWFMHCLRWFEGDMQQFVKAKNMTEVDQEKFDEGERPDNWPKKGKITFKDYKLRYRPELELVLKGLDL